MQTKETLEKEVYCVYKHIIIPINKYYVGYTYNPKKRFHPALYKDKSLGQYIDQYGWENIKPIIVAEGLTRKEAELLEDKLIKEGWERGDCINKQGSGGEWRDNHKEYQKKQYKKHRTKRLKHQKQYYVDNKDKIKECKQQYYQEHREEKLDYNRKYYTDNRNILLEKQKQYNEEHREEKLEYNKQRYQEHKEEILEKQKQYNKEHREEKIEYLRNWRSSPAGKIYNRVNSFNQRHPDSKTETPKEARQKYLETGYIPSYIKNNDLI